MATGQKNRMFRTHVDIPQKKRAQLVTLLNQHVAEALDLYSQVKQAHWNVKGKHFYSIHTLTDTFAAEVIEFVDDLAERATALGGYVHGTVRMAAEATTLPEYPMDLVDDMGHVAALVDRIGHFASSVRSAIDTAEELGDKDTADLYTGISRQVDKRLWFFEAHLQGEGDHE
ncbi:DNA starvation/stationary phase protection protein Dps [Tautonia sociabilis]|uniref:DNA starvation/stationary phase protection protein Dps n=1 Tax=Tautonia sociabilis TaxID=2080755 RepID=A0A432MNW0_9BACT|nr:DNA starvation/stationary phase protection protein Dps [Tautonia sociabilis]RUL88796.1 DNA starvation/stationary phase protection protein Dps [Tautonia sociabilis]